MSSIPQITDNGNNISDFATKFIKRFNVGRLLFKCNAGKEKGIPVMDIFRYLFCMVFSSRSIYMQMKTNTFGGSFSKNTIYRDGYCNGIFSYNRIPAGRIYSQLYSTSPKIYAGSPWKGRNSCMNIIL